MKGPVTASGRDLRTLAGIVSDDRADLPEEGLPPSLLADLMDQIRCDFCSVATFDSRREKARHVQGIPPANDVALKEIEAMDPVHWQHYWNCQPCSHPDRTGDLRSVSKIADFYSARQWHSTGMYSDIYRPGGMEHELQLCLPAPGGRTAGPGRTVRLYFFRGPGPDFSERDRALLTLLRPHLHQAYLDAERRRHPVPSSPPGSRTCCTCSPPATPTPRSPAASASPRGPCAPAWKTFTACCRSPAAPPPSPAPSPTRTA